MIDSKTAQDYADTLTTAIIGGNMKSYSFDFEVTVSTQCFGIEADSQEEAEAKLKEQWLDDFNIELTDDEITITDVEEVNND